MLAVLSLTWKYLLGAGAMLAICLFLHNWDVERLERKYTLDKARTIKDQVDTDIIQCNKTKQPAAEANDYDKAHSDNQLNACLSKLRVQPKCVPVYVTKPSGGSETACERQASGITSSELEAAKIGWQADRDALNAAKVFAQECIKQGLCQ